MRRSLVLVAGLLLGSFASAAVIYTAYQVIQSAGTPVSSRGTVNFIGPLVADNAGQNRTDITTGPAPAYGEMWFHNDSSPYTQALVLNTPAKVACFSALNSGTVLNGWTYATSALTVVVPGTYRVIWSMTFSSSNSGHVYHLWISINGVEEISTESHAKLQNSSDVVGVTGSSLLTLAAAQAITLYANDETAGSTISVLAANVNLVKINN